MSILVVDLSSILVPHYHAHGKRFGGNDTSDSAIRAVRSLAREYGQDGVAICCDCPGVPTWRHAICSHYKSERKPWESALLEQYVRAKSVLSGEFATFAVEGFEADDLMATVVARLWRGPHDFVVATSDKDAAQTVCARVSMFHASKKRLLNVDGVLDLYGVRPDQMRDLLCIAGDSSDSISGIRGIGEVRARQLLARFGTLEEMFRAVRTISSAKAIGVPPSVFDALLGGVADAELARQLVTLRKDAPIDVSMWRQA